MNQKTIKYLIIFGIIILIVGAGGFLAWQRGWIPMLKSSSKLTPEETEIPIEKPKEIGYSAVWDCVNIEGCLEKWHGCKSLDCISDVMKQNNASPDAIAFVTNFPVDKESDVNYYGNYGYLEQFQEMGKIDLGIVVFPDRANTNEEYYLLNGSPTLVSTGIFENEFINEIKQDSLYSEMKGKYPNIFLWGLAPKFVEKNILSNNNEEFVFKYNLVNEYRISYTEYSAKIGFDFDLDGKFLKIIFLEIIK